MPAAVQTNQLRGTKQVNTVGLTGLVNKLDFESIRGKDLYNGANFTCSQTERGQVAYDGNCVQ